MSCGVVAGLRPFDARVRGFAPSLPNGPPRTWKAPTPCLANDGSGRSDSVSIRIAQRGPVPAPECAIESPANRPQNRCSGRLERRSAGSRPYPPPGRHAAQRVDTRGPPRASLRRATSSPAIRSSSCAQTAERQATVSTPSRSATGVGLARDRRARPPPPRPAARARAAWPAPAVAANASTASASGRGAAAPHAACASASASTRPRRRARRAPSGVVGARHVAEVGGRDHALARPALAAQPRDEALAAVGVELAHHVVEQHQRRRAAHLAERLALGQQQREQGQALLALRAVGAQVATVARRARGRRGAGRAP